MNIESFIWGICDDVLRGLFKQHEYGDVILPFLVLRRLDCVQEEHKDEVVKLYNDLKDNDKIKFLENVNNIKLNVYEKCERNFTRISDKHFNESETLNSQKKTFTHILEAFKNPHTHS